MNKLTQEETISDIVLPLLIAEYVNAERTVIVPIQLYGTCFLIGNRGYALTAAHVIDQLHDAVKNENDVITTHIRNSTGLHPLKIIKFEKHPTEDVGIIKLSNDELKTWFKVTNKKFLSSVHYTGWGYPIEAAEELKRIEENAHLRPSLIYTEGYIRRTINNFLSSSIFIGKAFYEVSDLGGGGYSGSPILFKDPFGKSNWDVIGIYIGEKEGSGAPVGYVVRSDCFENWKPDILGCTIFEESNRAD
jgi:hypothetical protein